MDLKSVAIGIAIIILTSFVTVYGIALLYSEPEYEDYCSQIKTTEIIETEQRCLEIGGQWNGNADYPKETGINGYCDRDFTCRQEYETAMKEHYKKVFYVALPIGIIIIVIGAVFFGLESVGAGLMGGGIFTLIYGAGGYWQYAQNLVKFLLSLAGLIAIIYFAYWFNKRNNKQIGKKRR